ncbi:fimbrial protein [Erwinia persicina]|uniref:fimbrial protein n=1 Tax=Erwinia persicina TaxID=55211 RepID=UPI001784AA97|nr:fimbrial protein [Erwinia persicina]MBD8163262.1 type 1 fimbrial protein [Erwinia persicina]
MEIKKIAVASLFTLAASGVGHAADEGSGKVTFYGSIVNAPCSIAPNVDDQKIPLGQVSNTLLANGGEQTAIPFTIDLQNCDNSTKKSVTATFTGKSGVDGRLGITGEATGASILLRDGSGKKIELGTATAAQNINTGSNTLQFTAALKGDGTSDDPVAVGTGAFTAVTNFTLAYP